MIAQSFRMALSAIRQNKMRSFLTMLGIIIGVMAVVVLVSITTSSTSSITDEFQSMGASKLSVNIMGMGVDTLTMDEVSEIAADSDNISLAVPSTTQSSTAKAGSTSETASVTGTTGDYLEANSLELENGRFIKTPDLSNNVNVAVLGSEIAGDLFGDTDIVGETISLDGRSFEVIGVLADTGSELSGSDNTSIIIPYTVAQRMYYVSGVSSFTVIANDSDSVNAAESDLERALMAKYNDEDSFRIMNQSSMLESLDSVNNTMALMLGGIAGIALLVGGIGIMNIMLVSVTERTREIGIRKAIGAGRRRILSQFLVEALVLSVSGGLIGIAASWVLLTVLSAVLATSYTMSVGVALLAAGFSLVIGLLFGISPANKAAKLPSIQALRTQ